MMTIHLVSHEHVVSARMATVLLGDVGSGVSSVAEAPCAQNVMVGLPVIAPGLVTLTLLDCVVLVKRTGQERQVSGMILQGMLKVDDLDKEMAFVDLPPSTFVRIQVADDKGRSVEKGECIGLATLQGTLEGRVNGSGRIDLFVACGPVTAYFCDEKGSEVHALIEAPDPGQDDYVIWLRPGKV